jgi:geranylgeranyl pyrophosphate synthase
LLTPKPKKRNTKTPYLVESMDTNELKAVKELIVAKGGPSQEKAKTIILNSDYNGGLINSALHYFVKVSTKKNLPVFPALLALSSEAVGKSFENSVDVGASLVLIAWAADIHDDIIDRSEVKYGKKTVYGKYGSEVALLAGDALLAQGYNVLYNACIHLSEQQRSSILGMVTSALFEISQGEAKEVALRKKEKLSPQEILGLLRLKAVVPALNCKIGSTLADADEKIVKILGNYGEAFGIVSLMIEEYIDLLDYDELRSRVKNEYLPLPIIYSFQDSAIKNEIDGVLYKNQFNEKDHETLVKTVIGSHGFSCFKKKLSDLSRINLEEIKKVPNKETVQELTLLLEVIGKKTV